MEKELELETVEPQETKKEKDHKSFMEYYQSINKKCDLIIKLIEKKYKS